jgi:hypothetical protein
MYWNRLTREQRHRLWAAIPGPDEKPLPASTIYTRQDSPRLPSWRVQWALRSLWQEGIIEVPLTRGKIFYYRRARPKVQEYPIAQSGVSSYNGGRETSFPITADVDRLLQVLYPLRRGQSVNLWLDVPAQEAGLKRQGPKPRRLVVIAPWSALKLPQGAILIAVIGSGSNIIRLSEPKERDKKQVASLVLAGMPARLAQELMNKIRQVFDL